MFCPRTIRGSFAILICCSVGGLFVTICWNLLNSSDTSASRDKRFFIGNPHLQDVRDTRCDCESETIVRHNGGSEAHTSETGPPRDVHQVISLASTRDKKTLRMRSDDNQTIFEAQTDGLSDRCLRRKYGTFNGWPKASVIIPFCDNERIEDVLHTVHSIIQRTPDKLLEEILLIADNTSKGVYKEVFDNYCNTVFGSKVHIIRSNVTLGLIKGRLLGSRLARGEVIVTMDAHMEVQKTWLEALLWEIKLNRKTMGTATLDWMHHLQDGKWRYQHGPDSFMCMFSWDLGFGFGYPRPKIERERQRHPTRSFPAPCSVGTIWAMDKAFFREIGELDEGMYLWGGENLELPLRVWLFGGRVVQVPCAHAAHLERPHQRDYRNGWDSFIQHNYKRVVEVWFDEYKEHAYREYPELRAAQAGNITSRLALKHKATHNFKWFLSNVYPELGIFDNDTFAYDWVQNEGMKKCIHINVDVLLWECLGQPRKENIWLTTDGHLRTGTSYWVARGNGDHYKFETEGATGTYQEPFLSKWIHWEGGPLMVYDNKINNPTRGNLCLQGYTEHFHNELRLAECNRTDINQRWTFKTYSKDWETFSRKGIRSRFNSKYHKTLLKVKNLWTGKNTNTPP